MRIIFPVHAGLIMHTQGCSCGRMILPRNPNFISFDFAYVFTCNAFVLDPLSYIYGFRLLFHKFNCLFAFHMLELGFTLCFPCFNAMNMHSHVHA